MRFYHTAWLGALTVIACSSQEVDAGGRTARGNEHVSGMDDGGAPDGDAPDATPGVRLTPSNLPPDICDRPGAGELNVPANTSAALDPGVPCDALVPQRSGLPSICVRKYSKVQIAGTLALRGSSSWPASSAVAIVATDAFLLTGSIAASGTKGTSIHPPAAPDGRGNGGFYGGGAGHATAGARSGGSPAGQGGPAYPTSGTELAAGSNGGEGESFGPPPGERGKGGGAIQLVSCGTFELMGSVDGGGGSGGDGHRSLSGGSGGGGGGSGGTLLIEALRITGTGAALRSLGGNGGWGGDTFAGNPGGSGGSGGTGSAPPTPGYPGGIGPTRHGGPGGGGASVGFIRLNVPAGTPIPNLNADPPASLGTVPTH
ncbi:hypothetical protein [Pendulispora albinea]|uniref:Lipoprotein n=1 Tax=Pendulispora albinea TaxID=2741071 RepID=A0ABZ2MCX8_9BACT